MCTAAECGHLHVLMWAREHGCPWDKSTSEYAVNGGQMAVLKWAKEHGCPCPDYLYRV